MTFPSCIYARLEGIVDYSILQESKLTFPRELKSESSLLLLDCYGTHQGDASEMEPDYGHFASRKLPGWFLVWKIARLAGQPQPARIVIAIEDDAYQAFGFNPFEVLRGGFFEFASPFLERPSQGEPCDPATGNLTAKTRCFGDLSGDDKSLLAKLITPLLQKKSLMLKLPNVNAEMRRLLELGINCLPPEIIKATTLFTFAFGTAGKFDFAKPCLAAIWQPGLSQDEWHRQLVSSPTTEALNCVDAFCRKAGSLAESLLAPEVPDLHAQLKGIEQRMKDLTTTQQEFSRQRDLIAVSDKLQRVEAATMAVQASMSGLEGKESSSDLLASVKNLNERLARIEQEKSQPSELTSNVEKSISDSVHKRMQSEWGITLQGLVGEVENIGREQRGRTQSELEFVKGVNSKLEGLGKKCGEIVTAQETLEKDYAHLSKAVSSSPAASHGPHWLTYAAAAIAVVALVLTWALSGKARISNPVATVQRAENAATNALATAQRAENAATNALATALRAEQTQKFVQAAAPRTHDQELIAGMVDSREMLIGIVKKLQEEQLRQSV